MNNVVIITWFSAASFFCYGVTCLASTHMRTEFARFGLARMRILTGVLQLMGAAGLVLGLRIPLLGCIAAAGLALLMFLGFSVRLKIRDSVVQSSPALIYMLVNGYLTFAYANLI